MRELPMNPGESARVWVEDIDGTGKRVMVRFGNARARVLRPLVAESLAELLQTAANEARLASLDVAHHQV